MKMALLSHVDSTYDRYSRVFMFTMLLSTSIIMMVEYFSYRISCAQSYSLRASDVYVEHLCWSHGLFLYKDMIEDLEIRSVYYGIPIELGHDGIVNQTKLHCKTKNSIFGSRADCIPMNRVYFKEYQWLPFYFGMLSFLFLLPFVLFRMVNPDLYSLSRIVSLTSRNEKTAILIQSYFDHNVNSAFIQFARLFLTLIVKIGYIAVNVFAFLYTASILKGNFRSYGNDVLDWENRNKSIPAVHPKTALLPTVGLCQLTLVSSDALTVRHNKHLFICEIPSNAFYQNIVLFHWYIFIFGITVSVIGLVVYIGQHVLNLIINVRQVSDSGMSQMLTLRGMEYLDLIKDESIPLYSKVLREWKRKSGGGEVRNILEEGRDEDYQL